MSKDDDDRRTREVLEAWRKAAPPISGLAPEEAARALLSSLADPLPRVSMPYSVLARAVARDSDEPALWVGALRALPAPDRRGYEEEMTAEYLSAALRRRFEALLPVDEPAWAGLVPGRSDRSATSVPSVELEAGPLLVGDPWSHREECLAALPQANGPVKLRLISGRRSVGPYEALELTVGSKSVGGAKRTITLETDTAFLAIGPPEAVRALPDGPFGDPGALLDALVDTDLVIIPTGVALLAPSAGAGGRVEIEVQSSEGVLQSARLTFEV